MSENTQQTLIENHTVDYVPPAERHGREPAGELRLVE